MKSAFWLLFISLVAGVSCEIQCIGEDGEKVDMFVLYKLPRITWYPTPELIHNGTAYAYLDSNDMKFRLSEYSITSEDSSAGKTLNQVYKNAESKNQAHVFYNDAFNDTEHFDAGHSKGTLAFDGDTGYWMLHSVPKYPPMASDGYSYPSSGHKYGQMFMCITFAAADFDTIGMQLRYNNVFAYDGFLPTEMQHRFPNIDKLLQGEMVTTSPFHNIVPMTSLGGVQFLSFAKSTDFNHDLYSQLVAPTLKASLFTETWQNDEKGTENLGSTCNQEYTVEDISNVTMRFVEDNVEYPFETLDDHSKYAVGKTELFVCIGDINRQREQFHRGGGTLCTKDEELHQTFTGLIAAVNKCKKRIEF